MLQAVAGWSQFLSDKQQKKDMCNFVKNQKLYIPVPVSDLLWGRNMTLWENVPASYKYLVPNDTFYGLMYRVSFI